MSATCSVCHTGSNDATDGIKDMPFVTDLALPTYGPGAGGTLAGGSFYWVAGGFDLKGHNVAGVGATQVLGRLPPGGSTTFDSLTCSGTNGCHGNRSEPSQVKAILGSHHAPEVAVDGLSVATSYRLLDEATGVEDNDWEYSLAASDHNQYKGNARGADTDLDNSTISHLCATCHGKFHSGSDPDGISNEVPIASPWIRHPVDFDMGGIGGEYLAYGPGGAYNVLTPLADNIATSVLSNVNLVAANNDAIITCITCHRAHGSPYDYSLRWDYKSWPGGDNNGGCYHCHTVKN